VVMAEGVSGVVYKEREVIQVWVGRGRVFGGVVVRAAEMSGKMIQVEVVEGQGEPGFGPTPPLQ
jgi:hypothetical protein